MIAEPPKPKQQEKESEQFRFGTSPKDKKVRLVVAVVSALSLLSLYLYFLNYFFAPLLLAPMSTTESTIFYTMILRALGLSFVPFLRKLHPQIKILVFSVEAFILCVLIVGFVFTSYQPYNTLMSDVLTTWLGATLIILTPYSFYELALMMYKGTNMTALFVSSTPLIAISLFLANLVGTGTNPSGLEDFGKEIIDSLRTQPGLASAANSTATASTVISLASVVFFLSIIIYIAFTLNTASPAPSDSPKYHYALALMLIGSLVSYVWVASVSSLLRGNIIEILSVPAAIIPAVLWVITRRGR